MANSVRRDGAAKSSPTTKKAASKAASALAQSAPKSAKGGQFKRGEMAGFHTTLVEPKMQKASALLPRPVAILKATAGGGKPVYVPIETSGRGKTRISARQVHYFDANAYATYDLADFLHSGDEQIPYGTIAARSASENSEVVKHGIRPAFVKRLADDLVIDQSVFTTFLGFARSTFNRKAKKNEVLSSGESAIALGAARIVGEVVRILDESGDPEQMANFNVAEWTGTWMMEPVPALGNKRPIDFLDNSFGQETVLQLVRQMQSGAFA